MSDILSHAKEALSARVSPGDLDFSVRFDIEGEGALRADETGVSESDAEADLSLSADAETFQAILSGDMNPASAMMSGKLSIDGDMGLAMKLGSALS